MVFAFSSCLSSQFSSRGLHMRCLPAPLLPLLGEKMGLLLPCPMEEGPEVSPGPGATLFLGQTGVTGVKAR